ncbi:MAG TPA: hypothetical protein DDZ19_04390 [Flavobacteriales bacterium]|jgi:uncharacterized membrane protein YphA (DoxX/SURF4 family)|nr:hypothetical protein [Flavobacteriales bacterium]
MDIYRIILLFSAISFIGYGINSIFSKRMISEYERWGFKNQRIILSCCQLLGGLGLLIGLAQPLMLSVASFLLTCMMLAAVVIRMRIKERAVKMLPALLYVILNSILFYNSIS